MNKGNSLLYLKLVQVKIAYVNFVNHCYVDTEVEMKEIYTSNHIWKLFENFLVDMARVSYTLTITCCFMFNKLFQHVFSLNSFKYLDKNLELNLLPLDIIHYIKKVVNEFQKIMRLNELMYTKYPVLFI